MWRENVLKDWHAIRFDRRPPAARAPTTTRPPRRRWRFATRCDASDVSRHLVDGDWRASTMHCIVETPTEKHPMLSIETANFFFSFSIHLFINIIDFVIFIEYILFIQRKTLQMSCTCMRASNNFYHGSVSIYKAWGKRVKTQRSGKLLLFVHSTKEEGNSNRIICRNFRQSFKFSKGNVGRQ